MRASAPGFDDVVRHSFRRVLKADVYYGAERLIENIPLDEWSLNGDIDADIKTGASVTVSYTGDFGETVTPRELTDALAPFGQELRLYMEISAGGFKDRIAMGAYRIEDVPSATDAQMRFRERLITKGSTVRLQLLDRFYGVKRARFRALQEPRSLTSAWDEIARLSRLAVIRNVADVAIPRSVVYSRDRLDAIQQLAAVLGGRAFMRGDATLAIIPDTPAASVAELMIGEDGVVLDVAYALHSEDVYNVVVGDFEAVNGTPIHAEAAITLGPLSVNGPYGENVIEYPNDQKTFITTQSAADAAVAAYLSQVALTETFELPVQATLDPRLEIGDVVTVVRRDRLISGQIRKYTMGAKGPMSLTLGVIDEQPL